MKKIFKNPFKGRASGASALKASSSDPDISSSKKNSEKQHKKSSKYDDAEKRSSATWYHEADASVGGGQTSRHTDTSGGDSQTSRHTDTSGSDGPSSRHTDTSVDDSPASRQTEDSVKSEISKRPDTESQKREQPDFTTTIYGDSPVAIKIVKDEVVVPSEASTVKVSGPRAHLSRPSTSSSPSERGSSPLGKVKDDFFTTVYQKKKTVDEINAGSSYERKSPSEFHDISKEKTDSKSIHLEKKIGLDHVEDHFSKDSGKNVGSKDKTEGTTLNIRGKPSIETGRETVNKDNSKSFSRAFYGKSAALQDVLHPGRMQYVPVPGHGLDTPDSQRQFQPYGRGAALQDVLHSDEMFYEPLPDECLDTPDSQRQFQPYGNESVTAGHTVAESTDRKHHTGHDRGDGDDRKHHTGGNRGDRDARQAAHGRNVEIAVDPSIVSSLTSEERTNIEMLPKLLAERAEIELLSKRKKTAVDRIKTEVDTGHDSVDAPFDARYGSADSIDSFDSIDAKPVYFDPCQVAIPVQEQQGGNNAESDMVRRHLDNPLYAVSSDMQRTELSTSQTSGREPDKPLILSVHDRNLKPGQAKPNKDIWQQYLAHSLALRQAESETIADLEGIPVRALLDRAKSREISFTESGVRELRKRFMEMPRQEHRKHYHCGQEYVIPAEVPCWQLSSQQHTMSPSPKFDANAVLNQKVALWRGDITRLEVDAIVNSTSSILMESRGGVNKIICDAAGPLIDYEMDSIWTVIVGDVVSTAGYQLPAKYVFHVSGPPKYWENKDQDLASCYKSALKLMKKIKLRTMAFCCVATGAKGLKKDMAAMIALETTRKWLMKNSEHVDKIIFAVFDDGNWKAYDQVMSRVFPVEQNGELVKGPSLPTEILRMDYKSIDLYKQILLEGQEAIYSIRVMIVGHSGVGKTVLTKRLLGQPVDIKNRDSTDGIEVHVCTCSISLETGEWTVPEKDERSDATYRRLARLLREHSHNFSSLNQSDVEESLEVDARREDIESSVAEEQGGVEETGGSDSITHVKEIENAAESRDSMESVPQSEGEDDSQMSEADESRTEEAIMEDLKSVIHEASSANLQNSALVSLWDFAGQSEYYSTHQVFLSQRAVYLLVTDMSTSVNDMVQDDEGCFESSGEKACKVAEFIEFWLNSIHSYCPSSEPTIPPVILVGTHTDKLKQENKDELQDSYFMLLRDLMDDKPTQFHIVDKDFPIDNSAPHDPMLDELKKKILDVAKEQPYWGQHVPARWITLEKALQGLKEKNLKVIGRQRIQEINKTLPVPLASSDEMELFLRFQHDLGNILYFSEAHLQDHILLDPQWLIDALKCLITARDFCSKHPRIRKSWKQFKEEGILKHDLIDAVWNEKNNVKKFGNYKEHLLGLMERLDLIARPHPSTVDQSNTAEVADYYFVPCVLKERHHPDVLLKPTNFFSSSHLCFTTDSRFIPTAVFSRLLVACLAKWPVFKQKQKPCIYCRCGMFEVDVTHRLTVYFSKDYIQIWITQYGKRGSRPNRDLCCAVRHFVEEALTRIFADAGTQCEIEQFIKCPVSEEFHPFENFLNNKSVPCHCEDTTSHMLDSVDMLQGWEAAINETASYSTSFTSMLPAHVRDRVPDDREVATIARGIGQEFKQLGLELSLPGAKIGQICCDSKDVVECTFQIITTWKKINAQNATFYELEKAMRVVNSDISSVFSKFTWPNS